MNAEAAVWLHFFTSLPCFDENFAFVNTHLRLYGCLLLLMNLNFDKMFRMFSSSCNKGLFINDDMIHFRIFRIEC